MIKVNRGEWPPRGLQFTMNGSSFQCPYYLVDGIYPRHSLLVSPHLNPSTPRERTFNRLRDALRRDVERLYAILTSRFQIALRPTRSIHVSTLVRTAKAIAILHNMITEQRRNGYVSRSRPGHGGGGARARRGVFRWMQRGVQRRPQRGVQRRPQRQVERRLHLGEQRRPHRGRQRRPKRWVLRLPQLGGQRRVQRRGHRPVQLGRQHRLQRWVLRVAIWMTVM